MKAKWGMMVVDGRGKIGGHVASKNRGGAYFRTKVSPVNPQTSSQLGARNRFTNLSQAWSSLTQAQRDAWNAAVSDYARTDIFGDLRQPTGFNLYQRLNNVLVNCNESAVSTPPVPGTTPSVSLTGLTYTVGTPALSVAYSGTVDSGYGLMVFATAPQSAGRNFVKSQYRQIVILDDGDTSPVDILSDYTNKFGGVGSVGQKIFVKVVPVNFTTGQQGTASEVSAISAS